ncbi:MAG: hypothetical protein ACREMI_01895 [Gemmatimonadales bacterium]
MTAGRSDGRTAGILLLGLLAVWPSGRPAAAQVSVRLSLGARYSTILVHDSIEVPIDLKPTVAPALQLSVRTALPGPWAGEATLDVSPAKLKREESGASTQVGSFTALALTVGLRREMHAGIAARMAIGGLAYLTDKSSVFQQGSGGIFPLVALGTTYAPPFGARHRLEVGLHYDLHRFITPALRTVGYARLRPVHRIAITVSGRLVGQ